MVVLVLAVGVAVLLTLPEPPAPPPPTITPTPSEAPTATATWTPIPPRTPRVTSTPTSQPPTELPAATAVLATPTPRPTAPPGSTATPLPLVALTVPLPRSGFFIRRHNDFAPPDPGGLEALLADGITAGGEVVSLPPISPLTGVRVPAPRSDEGALALRYGLTEIPLSERCDAAATHYL